MANPISNTLASLLVVATCVFGQAPTISILKVAFDEPMGTKEQEYAKPIILKLRQPANIPREFHARLFRGPVASLKARHPDSRGCVHFSTARFRVNVADALQIRALDNPAWLRPVGDGFQAEQYTIVFKEGKEPNVEELLIHKRELDNYFQYAFALELLAPESLQRKVVELVKSAEETLKISTITYQQATKSQCWSVKTLLTG